MNRFSVCLLLLLDSALAFLPAPVNVSIHSVNFHHVMRWDPRPGTPPGTRYYVYRLRKRNNVLLGNTTMTSIKFRIKHPESRHFLAVQASFNHTSSNYSRITFSPFTDTKIGPPTLSLAGCGNCIQVNISLPEPDKVGLSDMHSYFHPQYKVSWKRPHGNLEKPHYTKNKIFTLEYLQRGTEYCVQVHPEITSNKHTEPSAWTCTFTSPVEPSRGPVVVGAVVGPLIFLFGGLMTSMLLLYHTGFICKLKALPRVLSAALSRGYTLTPERTVPDNISIIQDTDKHRKLNNHTTSQPATRDANSEEEDEEEDDEGMNVYMNRAAELSSGQTSCQDSADVSGNRTPAVSENSGSLTAKAELEVECDEEEAKNDEKEISLLTEGHQTVVQRHVTAEVVEVEEEEEEEEVCDSSGNINLLSVTLGALAGCEEEEQNTGRSLTDFLNLCDVEPLLPTDPQTDAGDRTHVMLPTQEDSTESGYEGRHAGTLSGSIGATDGETEEEEEEEEEDEEFSGYMKHTI